MRKYNYIYLTRNILNGMIYIGKHSTDDLNDGYLGSGTYILKAINKYGKQNFSKEILAYADTIEKLNYLERFYIRKYKAQNRNVGYNLAEGGQGATGYKHTTEARKNISLHNAKYWKNKHLSEETKQKISKNRKGKLVGEDHPLFNKHHSDITRKKQSVSHKGKGLGPKQKHKWLNENNEIIYMPIPHVKRFHPQWILIN